MKKISSLVIVTLSIYFFSMGQMIRRPVAANYISIGAYSTIHSDIFSFTANQASLARFKNTSAAVYGERRFMLNELSLYKIAFALPTRSGNFGLNTGYYGFAAYNETQAGLAYSKNLGNKIDIGVQFNYNGIKAAGYGNAYAISMEAGIILHLTDKLNAGIHVNNPAGGKYNKGENEKLPFVYTAGLGYDASETFFVSAEVQKEEDQPVNVNAGLQYKFLPRLLARAGIATATSAAWFGIGIEIRPFRLDVTAGYHPQLGITPGLLLVFNFPATAENEKKNQ
jgi:hypothetical protein